MTPQDSKKPLGLNLSPWQVLESLGESIAVLDRDLRVVWLKEPLMPKRRPKDREIGRYCYQAFYNRDSPCEQQCPVQPVLASGQPHALERHFVDADGNGRWREARAYPIVDGNRRLVFVARISFDITDRKMKQARQERDQDETERALDEMNRLLVGQLPFQPQGGAALTKRELEVLRLLAQGLSKPRIGAVLGISHNTVKRHVVNIFNKLGVNGRTQAAVWAAHQGLV